MKEYLPGLVAGVLIGIVGLALGIPFKTTLFVIAAFTVFRMSMVFEENT